MKFRLTFKTPDVLDQMVDQFEPAPVGHETGETDEFYDATQFAKRYVKYGEEITIEFDTEKGTAVAVELRTRKQD